jgi:ribA/ribD-fused uncharacterized protein
LEPITSFTGQHFFLSNFFPISVIYEGIQYPTSEHAYVAAKTLDIDLRNHITKITHPGQAKKFGYKIELRPDWESIKVNEMRKILEIKFSPLRSDTPIRTWLEMTAPRTLIEGNTWGDTFWGESPIGNGKNMLGKLLMSLRDDISNKL